MSVSDSPQRRVESAIPDRDEQHAEIAELAMQVG